MLKHTVLLNGGVFFRCPHDNVVVDSAEDHKCAHALVGECMSVWCLGLTRDLDRFGNCSTCNSVLIFDRRAKFTHAEVLKSFLNNELGTVVGETYSRVISLTHFREVAGRWLTALRNRLSKINIETVDLYL